MKHSQQAWEPKRRRVRKLYATSKQYKPKPYEHKYEIHHVKFRRHGGTDDESNLIALTPEEHHALHDKADRKLRSANGTKVMARPGHAQTLARRRQQLHRHLVGEAKYSAHMRELAKQRWKVARINANSKTTIRKTSRNAGDKK